VFRSLLSTIVHALILNAAVFLPVSSVRAQTPRQGESDQERPATRSRDVAAEAELETGVKLTRNGRFLEAIPHFLAARGRVSNDFAADFNLALCYVATGQYAQAVPILNAIKSSGRATAGVYNLLAQALVGMSNEREAGEAFQSAVKLTPKTRSYISLQPTPASIINLTR